MVNAEIINQMDEVRNMCAYACISFSASSHATSTEPREITEVINLHSFSQIWVAPGQVAWPTEPMNKRNEQRMHAAKSDITLYIHRQV